VEGGDVAGHKRQYRIICPQWIWLSFVEVFKGCGKNMHIVGWGKFIDILRHWLIIILGLNGSILYICILECICSNDGTDFGLVWLLELKLKTCIVLL
jgi:hypothetical protein